MGIKNTYTAEFKQEMTSLVLDNAIRLLKHIKRWVL